jgi:serine O-acetyltransferase
MRAAHPSFSDLARLCREDAARWVVPGEVSDVAAVTPKVFLRLLAYHLSFRATVWLRLGSWLRACKVPGAATLVQHRLLRVYGLEISPRADIGGGLYIAHPVGCTISAERIGRNVTIIGSVTIGYNKLPNWPLIGDDVFVGTGARVLGAIEIGDGARVAANAVVLEDVPPGCTVAGAPARVVRRPSGAEVRARG